MAKVTLARAWNPGNNRYVRGDTVEVDEQTAAWLDRTGALADPVEVTEPDDETSGAPEGQDEPDDEDTEAAAPVESSDSEKPKKASSVDAWREYAEARGIETKGLTKAEIIAAVG